MVTDKNKSIKNLKICFALMVCLWVLAAVQLFAPPADWRFNTALFAGQLVFFTPLLYYARPVLRSGRQLLFSGVPSMSGLAFVACAAGFVVSIVIGISSVYGMANLDSLLLVPLALMLLIIFAANYAKEQSCLAVQAEDGNAQLEKTAAFVLPVVFALSITAALSWWFYGLGAATAWQVLGGALIAAGAGIFMLGDSLPLYYTAHKLEREGFVFNDITSAENCRRLTMVVFDESFIKTDELEITDVIGVNTSEAQLLAMAAALMSSAGWAQAALLQKAVAGMELPVCSNIIKLRGGITAQGSRQNIRLGRLDFVAGVADILPQFAKCEADFNAQGKTVFYITGGRRLLGIIAIGVHVDTSITPALAELRALGVRTVMFSSSSKQAAEYVGSKAGFAQTVAELSEEHQKELAETFCRAGEFLAVLKRGDDMQITANFYNQAVQSGGFVLKDGNKNNLAKAINISKRLQNLRSQNNRIALWLGGIWLLNTAFVWPLVYKSVLPGAWLAIMLMLSTLLICVNSRRL